MTLHERDSSIAILTQLYIEVKNSNDTEMIWLIEDRIKELLKLKLVKNDNRTKSNRVNRGL